ncbi:MAG: hypothetical protein IKP00_15355 [Victivallales bacterium]|nr:hypothetical protein [Victivallales bacterium]
MLKRCVIVLVLFVVFAFFAWLAFCASCTVPELYLSKWQFPPRCGVGQPFRLELRACGGLTPPGDALFFFHVPENADCQQSLSWHPVGICRKGFCWKATLLAWPVNVGAFGGIIATYLPQKTEIALPDVMITPSGELSPVWLEMPQNNHLVDIALGTTLLFFVLPCLALWVKALGTRQANCCLDDALLERLRRIQHPATPCLAFFLLRRKIVTYSATKANLNTLEAYCRKLL